MSTPEFESFDKVFSDEGATYLRLELDRVTDPIKYLSQIETGFERTQSKLLDRMYYAASLIEPVDRAVGVDVEFPAAHAFVKGGVLGIRIVAKFLDRDSRWTVTDIASVVTSAVPDSEGLDEDAIRHELAANVVNASEMGINMAAPYEPLLASIEDVVCPDITNQRFFHRGFGFLMFLIDSARDIRVAEHTVQDIHQMGHELDEGVQLDWDDWLGGLTGESPEPEAGV